MWEVLADGARWSEWGPWNESSLEREGTPPPDGVGAVRRLLAERRFLGRPVVNREEVVVFPRRTNSATRCCPACRCATTRPACA